MYFAHDGEFAWAHFGDYPEDGKNGPWPLVEALEESGGVVIIPFEWGEEHIQHSNELWFMPGNNGITSKQITAIGSAGANECLEVEVGIFMLRWD